MKFRAATRFFIRKRVAYLGALLRGLFIAAAIISWAAPNVTAQGATASGSPRELVCFVVAEEGASSEGNSLYLSKMGVDPEALRSFAPSRFTSGLAGFKTVAEGKFSYEADTPVLADRSGKLVLYEVPVRLSAAAPPKARATVTVEFGLKDLRSGGGIVQPAVRAMQLAAAKAGIKSGIAWIVEMERVSTGMLRAKVGLAY
jgi:hypothetical protein